MKGRKPWMKFYPQDWLGDPGLRACSSAARGLWIDLISLAHEATPYGHVLINGNVPPLISLARMTGANEAECESLIAELEANGVFSRTRQGIIYSRKMVRNERRAKEGEKAAKKRWDNEKRGGSEVIDKQGETTPPNGGPNGAPKEKPMLRSQKPEARKKERKETRGARGTRLGIETLPDDWRAFCLSERPDLDPERTFARFHDYWIAQPGQKGVKLDWLATWRNKVRNEKQERTNGSGNREKNDAYAGNRGFVSAARRSLSGAGFPNSPDGENGGSGDG